MFGARRLSCAFILVALLVVLFAAAPASAQSWPTRAVKFILTLGPGSGADIGARLLADRLTKKWNQPIVIENRPGDRRGPRPCNREDDITTPMLLSQPSNMMSRERSRRSRPAVRAEFVIHRGHPYQHDNLRYNP
jgi:hypothetical protein